MNPTSEEIDTLIAVLASARRLYGGSTERIDELLDEWNALTTAPEPGGAHA